MNGDGGSSGRWPVLAVTLALMAFAFYLVVKARLDGLTGAIIGYVAGYWLPVRPNRQPPSSL